MPRVTKYDENDEPIAGYRLVSFLGAGQFGEVWKALEEATRKLVAIKIIDLSHSNSALKELKALNLVINLNHPNLIPIFTARLKDKNGREIPLHKTEDLKQKGALRELVIAMGLGDKSLSSRLKEINPDGTDPADFRGLPVDELLGYMQGAARGIDFLNKADHGLGAGSKDGPIVHCDIKPDNMMIVSGEVQIADCGVAVIITPDVRQTKAAGSPAYSAPELTGNKPVPGTDQYALAISYYELRTGKLPFDEQLGQLAIMMAHAEGRLDFSHPILSEEEVRVLKWATAVRPKDRYATCLDMVKQLERAIEGIEPLEPHKLSSMRSGVVPTSRSRTVPAATSSPPMDEAMLRSTPNLPDPKSGEHQRRSDPAVSFELPSSNDDLRGTSIPNSDQILESSDAGLHLPKSNSTHDNFAAPRSTRSEIDISANNEFPDLDNDDATSGGGLQARGKSSESSPRSSDISRPRISMDPDDPLGDNAGTVELDPEIANIIKGSGAMPVPGKRVPTAQPPFEVQTQRPKSRPEVTPTPGADGKRSTEYPRETPAEEEAKSLPPWAKPQNQLPSWAQEAEQANSRSSTTWKEPNANKPGGGMAAKIMLGGVLVAGIAGAGAYLAGLIPGASSTAKQETDDSQTNNDAKGTSSDKDNKTAEPKIDSSRIAEIEKLIARKSTTDFDTAQSKIDQLPDEKIYDAEKSRLKALLAKERQALDAAIDQQVGEIDTLIKSVDPKSADPLASEAKLIEAERLILQLPKILPTRHVDKRTDWSNSINKLRVALTGTAYERELQKALVDLESRPKEQFIPQVKIVFEKYTAASDQNKIGQKLIEIGNKKPEMRDSIIAFLVEDTSRFVLLMPTEKDREPVLQWRTAPLKVLAENLRAKLAQLTTGRANKALSDEINTLLNELSDKKKSVGTPFGSYWNEQFLDPIIAKVHRLATDWSDADRNRGDGLRRLREYVLTDNPPDLALPMVMEYLRIGSEKSESIKNLRDARNAAAKWKIIAPSERATIEQMFESSLARFVARELTNINDKPRWNEILKACENDSALGWRALVQAESDFETSGKASDIADEDVLKAADETQVERKAFLGYLKAITKPSAESADALLNLYKSPLAILKPPMRTKRSAAVLATHAITLPTKLPKPQDVLNRTWKPYAANNRKALNWLMKADELDGRNHPEWLIQLYLLADACDDQTIADTVAARIPKETAVPSTNEEIAVRLAYFVSRASTETDRPAKVASYATAARLALRLFERTTDPTQLTMDERKSRTDDAISAISNYAQRGLDLMAGNNTDKRSLELANFRNDFRTTIPNRDRIEAIARELPRSHPDYADARAFKAYLTLLRFGGRNGDLKDGQATQQERDAAWREMITDAEDALSVEPDNALAAQTLAFALTGTFEGFVSPYPPPDAKNRTRSYVQHRAELTKAIQALKVATESTRAQNPIAVQVYWRLRATFLFKAGNTLAKSGAPQSEVRELLQTAAKSSQRSYDLRPEKPLDDIAQLARIYEDLAWLAQDHPKENYEQAIKTSLAALERPRDTAYRKIDAVRVQLDIARTIIRGVRFGYLPTSRLREADDALAKLATEFSALSDADQQTEPMKTEGEYWRAIRQMIVGETTSANRILQNAEDDFRTKSVAMYYLGFVNRMESLLADPQRAPSAETLEAVRGLGEKLAQKYPEDFAADYVLARAALADSDTTRAATHFAEAYRKIDQGHRNNSLVVEEAFVLRCLAYEITKINLNANQRNQRIRLLTQLHEKFGWTLTAADRTLVNTALTSN